MAAPVIEYHFDGIDYIIEEILDKRRVKIKGRSDVFRIEYYIKWKGISASENTWEPENEIKNEALIEEFEERRKRVHAENIALGMEALKRARSGPTRFDLGLQPLGIGGVMNFAGVQYFLVEWKGCSEMELIPASIVNIKAPEMVIAFYESRLRWRSMSAGRIIREEEEKIREDLIAENRGALRKPGAGPSSSAS